MKPTSKSHPQAALLPFAGMRRKRATKNGAASGRGMFSVLGAVVGTFLIMCTGSSLTNGGSGTGVGNGVVMGKVIYPDSSPVAGAVVRLRPQTYLADTSGKLPTSSEGLIDSFTTDSDGVFRIDTINVGNTFSIEVNDRGKNTQATLYKLSIIKNDTVRLTTRAVNPVAALSGTITIPGLPANAYIQIYGLERIGRTDSQGRYAINDLPVGKCEENECDYKIRILIPNAGGGFTVKESELEVTAGGRVTLDD
jgi:hypothetical protein